MKYLLLFLFIFEVPGKSRPFDITEAYLQDIGDKIFNRLGGQGKHPTIKIGKNSDKASIINDIILISEELVIEPLKQKYLPHQKAFLDDALAIIIGHEIWHYIRGDKSGGIGFTGDNGCKFQEEFDADLHGLLGALLFSEYGNAGKILSDVYEIILPESNMAGYSSKEERKKTNDKLIQILEESILYFEAGSCLLISAGTEDQFRQSRECFLKTARDLAYFKELNYNIGLTWLLQAIKRTGIKFLFPVEIEGSDFMEKALKRSERGANQWAVAKPLLDSASVYFRRALALDNNFFDAYLALYTVDVIKQKNGITDDLYLWIEKYKGTTDQKAYAQMRLLRSLALLIYDETSDSAKKELHELANPKSGVSGFAKANLLVLSKSKKAPNSTSICSVFNNIDTTNDMNWFKEASTSKGIQAGNTLLYLGTRFTPLVFQRMASTEVKMSETCLGFTTGSGIFYNIPLPEGTSYDLYIRKSGDGHVLNIYRIIHYK